MKKKLISKTYLRDVNKYEMKIYFDQDEYYLTVKKFIDVEKPFIVQKKDCLLDDNYYIVELIPKRENYAMRIFLNDKKEILLYYFDITLGNGIDEETRIPYYNDLYLDVIIRNKKIEILDEDELQEALDKKLITQSDFDLAYEVMNKLIESIKNKENKYMNIDINKFLNF